MLAKTWDRLPSGNDVITEELYIAGVERLNMGAILYLSTF